MAAACHLYMRRIASGYDFDIVESTRVHLLVTEAGRRGPVQSR